MTTEMNRILGQQDYELIKSYSATLVSLNGGFCKASRLVGRVGTTSLHNYCNPDRPNSFMPIDIAADLQAQIGRPVLSRELTQLAYDHSTAKTLDQDQIVTEGARITALNGAFQATALAALEDGNVCGDELKELVSIAKDKKTQAADLYDRLCGMERGRA